MTSAIERAVVVSEAGIKRRIRGWHVSLVVLLAKPRERSDATALVAAAIERANASTDHGGTVRGDCVFAADAGAMFHLQVQDWNDDVRAG